LRLLYRGNKAIKHIDMAIENGLSVTVL
jgi:hypothetical protein